MSDTEKRRNPVLMYAENEGRKLTTDLETAAIAALEAPGVADHGVQYATVWQASDDDELNIECRMKDGQKGAFVQVDREFEDLAHWIAEALSRPFVDPAAIRRAALEEAITAIRDARPMPHNLMSVQYAQDIIRALADERAKTEADRDLFTTKGLIEVIRRIRKEAAYGQADEFVFALDVFASRMQAWVEKRGRYFSDKEPTNG